MRIFADYADEIDENAPEPSADVYETAIPVVAAAPGRRTQTSKPAKARRRPQRATQARKAPKPTKKAASSARKVTGTRKPAKATGKPARKPKRAQGRRPGLRRGWSAKD
jgi:hypothetical protein